MPSRETDVVDRWRGLYAATTSVVLCATVAMDGMVRARSATGSRGERAMTGWQPQHTMKPEFLWINSGLVDL